MILRLARRNNGRAEIWLVLKNGEEYYYHPKHPKTSFEMDSTPNGISAENIQIKCVEPFKIWNVKYNGKMRKGKTDELVGVEFDLNFHATTCVHDTERNVEIKNLAKAIAREGWTKQFFEELKNTHQLHYDQWGMMRGKLVLDGKKINFKCNSIRDHSYGQRDWQRFRYSVNFFSTNKGYKFYIANINLPTTSCLNVGYVFYPCGNYENILENSLDLVKLGAYSKPLSSFGFTIKTKTRQFSIFCQGNFFNRTNFFFRTLNFQCNTMLCLKWMDPPSMKELQNLQLIIQMKE